MRTSASKLYMRLALLVAVAGAGAARGAFALERRSIGRRSHGGERND